MSGIKRGSEFFDARFGHYHQREQQPYPSPTMKYLLVLLLPFALAITVFAGPPPDDTRDIQGTWLPIKAELGGEPMKDDFLTNTVMKLDRAKYEVTVAGSPDKGAYSLDAESKPKTIDISGEEGPNAGRKILGIYELQDNTLKICYGLGHTPAPPNSKVQPARNTFS
jgi:uncharacterized protein (TIGR03067 family)